MEVRRCENEICIYDAQSLPHASHRSQDTAACTLASPWAVPYLP